MNSYRMCKAFLFERRDFYCCYEQFWLNYKYHLCPVSTDMGLVIINLALLTEIRATENITKLSI